MTKQEAYKIVFKDLIKSELFCGQYDAKHGNEHFMYGILTVMEVIAMRVNDQTYFDFEEKFLNNLKKSEEKAWQPQPLVLYSY